MELCIERGRFGIPLMVEAAELGAVFGKGLKVVITLLRGALAVA